MAIKHYKPTTPARRKSSVLVSERITKKKPEKSLVETLKKKAGRDNKGRISSRHRGGGSKRKYRIISSLQKRLDKPAKVIAIEYDPNRTSLIALIRYYWRKLKAQEGVVNTYKLNFHPVK